MKTWLIATLTLAATLGATAQTADPLKAAVAADNRLVGNVARDAARHPYETLSFFGVKPTDTVVELAPGESAEIQFDLSPDRIGYYDTDGNPVTPEGSTAILSIGAGQPGFVSDEDALTAEVTFTSAE